MRVDVFVNRSVPRTGPRQTTAVSDDPVKMSLLKSDSGEPILALEGNERISLRTNEMYQRSFMAQMSATELQRLMSFAIRKGLIKFRPHLRKSAK